MNVKVQTEVLEDQAHMLIQVQHRLTDISEQVRRVEHMMTERSLADRFIPSLEASIRGIERLEDQTHAMSRGLNRIAETYRKTENHITDHAEGNEVPIRRPSDGGHGRYVPDYDHDYNRDPHPEHHPGYHPGHHPHPRRWIFWSRIIRFIIIRPIIRPIVPNISFVGW